MLKLIADYILGCPDGFDGNNKPTFSPGNCPYTSSDPCEYNGNPIPLYVCQNLTYPTMQQCAESCVSDESKAVASEMMRGLVTIEKFQELLYNHIFPILECKLITETYYKAEDILCVSLVYVHCQRNFT